MSADEDYPFHKLTPRKFEELAATVVSKRLQIHLVSFSEGKDGGRDAVARNVVLKNVAGEMSSSQNVVMQAKHTRQPLAKLDDSSRNRVFHGEVGKVQKLVKYNELDAYIAVTNYGISGGQERKMVKMFSSAGCSTVIVVGRDTLVRWIRESRELRQLVPSLYGIGGQNTRQLAMLANDRIHQLQKTVNVVLTKIEDRCNLDGRPYREEVVKQLEKHRRTSAATNNLVTALKKDVDSKSESINQSVKELAPPLRSIGRSVSCTQDTLEALAVTVQKNQSTLESVKRKLQKYHSEPANFKVRKQSHQRKPDGAIPPSCAGVQSIHADSTLIVGDDVIVALLRHHSVLKDWKFLARSLGVSECDIVDIQQSHHSLKEQAYQALNLWRENCHDDGMVENLVAVLKQWNLHVAAYEVQQMTSSTSTTSTTCTR